MNVKTILAAVVAAVAAQGAAADIVTNPPGESRFYEYSNVYFFNTGAGVSFYTGNKLAMEMVYDGTDVYMLDPVRGHLCRSFIKGRLDSNGNTVSFDFPQLVERKDGESYYVSRLDAKYTPGSDGRNKLTYEMPEGENTISFAISADGTLTSPYAGDPDSEYPAFIIGTVNEAGVWDGNGDANYSMTLTDLRVTTPPAGRQAEKWIIEYDNDGATADVVIDGDDFYFGNFAYQSRHYLHGKIGDDNIVRFEGNQFAGVTSTFFNFFTAIECEKRDDGDDWYYAFPTVEEIGDDEDIPWLGSVEFAYDPERRELSLLEPGRALMYNLGLDYFYPFVLMYNPTLRAIPSEPVYAAPRTPEVYMVAEYDDSRGFGQFVAELPKLDVNGNLLDVDKTWFEVYFDDDLMEFSAPDYRYVASPMTRVPYTYSDEFMWDIYTTGNLEHYVTFYVDVEKVAVRMITESPDGTLHTSDFGYWPRSAGDVSTDSLVAPTDDQPAYYDMMGRRVAPAPGQLVIRRTPTGTSKVVYGR